ncbi:MAG: FAD-binding oxidoreductase [Bdellovibrionales bacterium]
MQTSLETLKSFLREDQIFTDADSLKTYGRDWTRYVEPQPLAIVFPKTTEEVAQIVRWARKTKTSIVPSGGRTGLSGAAVAAKKELVLSLEKMNKELEFNELDSTLRVEAGMVTEDLQNLAKEKELYFPVDFASRGSSQIGGNVSTNAGGIKVLKYGLIRNWIAALKVVTGAGEVLELNKSLVKNASGYDLRHLMIGSEGTLGIVTEVTVRLCPPTGPLNLFLMGVPNLDAVMKIFEEYRNRTDLIAFELFTDKALKHVLNHAPSLKKPFETAAPIYLLVEVETPSEQSQEQALGVFESLTEQGLVVDGVLSQNENQSKDFWRLREDISEALSRYTPYKNDISVKVSNVPQFMRDIDTIFSKEYPDLEVIWFGHIGDGNLHISILKPTDMPMPEFVKRCQKVDQHLYSSIQKFGGSISAEHGVGLTKKPFLQFTRSPEEIQLMRQIKRVFDPDYILNPGKIFDETPK